ncbi:MAG: TlpA family protein disulfide reductase [Acidobacteria bacterium]|nr:TlpA family protein disulfide reductase [Acidobacteriota bacterium]
MRREAIRGLASIVTLVLLGGTSGQAGQTRSVIADVRAAIAQQDFARGETILEGYRSAHGVTPEVLEAFSWLGRGALAARQWDKADAYAKQTYDLALSALKGRSVDQEPHLPIALGAAIEVQAHVRAARGARSEAVYVLGRERETYRDTSLSKRIQKNIHLLSLEGKPAPAIDLSEYLGPKPPTLEALKGKVVLLFFWAHWCPDCKIQGPILASVVAKYGQQGLTVLAPTQRFGFVAAGRSAGPEEEARYIDRVRRTSYSVFADQPVPLSATNHERYGVSTTPTLVLVDREGIVRLYHPGRMTEKELEPLVRRLVTGRAWTEQ